MKRRTVLALSALIHIAVGAGTMLLVFTAGDFIDALGYMVLWLLLPLLSWLLIPRSGGAWWANILLWSTSHAAIISALNRVNGYPDNELLPWLIFPIWGVLGIGVLAVLIRRQWAAAMLCAAMIALPIVEGPIFVARQIVAQVVVPDALYTSHLGWNHAIQVDRNRSGLIAIVYRRDGLRYSYQESIWFLDGQGSMDAQYPNLPILLDRLIL